MAKGYSHGSDSFPPVLWSGFLPTEERRDHSPRKQHPGAAKKFLLSPPGEKFLEDHPEEIKKMGFRSPVGQRTGTIIISRFLGGNWNEAIFDVTPEKQGYETPYKASLLFIEGLGLAFFLLEA